MANQPGAFRQHHVTKLLKAAAAAGVPNPSVEVHLLPSGAKLVVGRGKDTAVPTRPVVAKALVRPTQVAATRVMTPPARGTRGVR